MLGVPPFKETPTYSFHFPLQNASRRVFVFIRGFCHVAFARGTAACFARPPVIMAGHQGDFSALHGGQHVAKNGMTPISYAIYMFQPFPLQFQQFLQIYLELAKQHNHAMCS